MKKKQINDEIKSEVKNELGKNEEFVPRDFSILP